MQIYSGNEWTPGAVLADLRAVVPAVVIRSTPPISSFTRRSGALIRRLRTPAAVQRFLNALPYNTEPPPEPATLRSFRGVVRRHTAHCLEAAISAAVILEQHGYPPLVMSLESIDGLDHVIFVYRARGRWGSVARSRDPGLHGRQPVFRTLRQLALSYFEPFIDATGCVKAYGAGRSARARRLRLAARRRSNVWKVERLLFDIPHRPIRFSTARVKRCARATSRFASTFRIEADLLRPDDLDERFPLDSRSVTYEGTTGTTGTQVRQVTHAPSILGYARRTRVLSNRDRSLARAS